MPFELFPAIRNTDRGKRKLEDDTNHDGTAGNQKNLVEDRGKEAETTTDEEVEEFFAILKRLHAATKYIQKIDGASHLLMGKRSKSSEEVPKEKLKIKLDLDLNLEPPSDDTEMRSQSQSQNPKASSGDSHRN